MIIKYGELPLPILYTDSELDLIIDSFINLKKKKKFKYFSYKELCNYLFNEAKINNHLKIESDVVYNSPVLAEEDATRISYLIWHRIWNKEIFIDFFENKYTTHLNDDIRFCIVM